MAILDKVKGYADKAADPAAKATAVGKEKIDDARPRRRSTTCMPRSAGSSSPSAGAGRTPRRRSRVASPQISAIEHEHGHDGGSHTEPQRRRLRGECLRATPFTAGPRNSTRRWRGVSCDASRSGATRAVCARRHRELGSPKSTHAGSTCSSASTTARRCTRTCSCTASGTSTVRTRAGAARHTPRGWSSRSTTARPPCASTHRSSSSGATRHDRGHVTRAPVPRAARSRPLRCGSGRRSRPRTPPRRTRRRSDRRRLARPASRGRDRERVQVGDLLGASRPPVDTRRRALGSRARGTSTKPRTHSCTRISAAGDASRTREASRCTGRCAGRVRAAARRSRARGTATTPASRTGVRAASRSRCSIRLSGSWSSQRDLGVDRGQDVADRVPVPWRGTTRCRRDPGSPSASSPGSCTATPDENVVTASVADQLLRTRSSAACAPSEPAAGSTIANSSPPYRATQSTWRVARRRQVASVRSVRSPSW